MKEEITFADIYSFANDFLDAANPYEYEWDSINWGDLKCVDVVKAENTYYITIEECAPSCVELPNKLAEALSQEFQEEFIVHCEW